jgi:hypothetical protein
MRSSPPLRLWPEDKLHLLRLLDEFRFWHSLDDERHCVRCHRTITGKQILVFERQGGRSKMRLQCPTDGCVSTPSEWAYADPMLAASFTRDVPQHPYETSDDDVRILREALLQAKHPGRRRSSPSFVSKNGRHANGNFPKSVRAILARLPILRPIAMGLHAIHPVI